MTFSFVMMNEEDYIEVVFASPLSLTLVSVIFQQSDTTHYT